MHFSPSKVPLYCMPPSSCLDYYNSPPAGLLASTLSLQPLPSPHRLWPQTERLFLQIFLASCPSDLGLTDIPQEGFPWSAYLKFPNYSPVKWPILFFLMDWFLVYNRHSTLFAKWILSQISGQNFYFPGIKKCRCSDSFVTPCSTMHMQFGVKKNIPYGNNLDVYSSETVHDTFLMPSNRSGAELCLIHGLKRYMH